jgi:CDGSH iron-sulfur domain-containing protein 3
MLEIGDIGDAFQIYNGVFLLLCMARFVRKEDRGPMEVKVGNESRWICMCGLSNNQPFCDGSHKKTVDEEAGKTYIYNADGSRSETD